MPLLGQKIYLAKFQEKRNKKGKGTFEIPFTNEVFTSKDDYDKQMQSYKQPIWTCQCTGFTGLTYEEALRSETEVHKRLSSKFPRSLEKPVLELVHHRAAPLDVIVDEAQQRIQSIFEVGEMVELKVKVRGKVIRGKIVDAKEMSDDEIPTSDKENSVTEDHPYSSPQSHSKQNKSSPFQYNIQLDGEDKVISAIPGKDLLHTSALPSRDLLQLFIRASAVQAGSKPSSPWVVSEDLVRKFGLQNKINEVMLSPFKVMPSSLVKLTSVKRPAESHDMASKPKKRKLSENNSGVSKFKQSSLMDFNKKDNMVLSIVLQREQNTSNMGLFQNTLATPPKHNPNIMTSPEKVQLDHSYSSPPPHLKAASRSPPKKHRSPKGKKDSKSSKRDKVDKVEKRTKKARASKKSKSEEDKRTTKTSRSKTHSKKSSKKKADSSGSESDDIVVIDELRETSKSTKSSKYGKTETKQDDIIVVDDSPVRSTKKTHNEKKADEVSSKEKKRLPTKRKLTDHFKAFSGSSPRKSPSKHSKVGSSAKSEASGKSPVKAIKAKSTPVKADKSKKKSASKAEVEVSSSEEEDFQDNDKKKSKTTAKKQPAVKTKKDAVKKVSQKKKQQKDTKPKKSTTDKVRAQKETPKKETPKKETSQKATPKKPTPAKATPKKTDKKVTPRKVTPKKTPSKSTPNKTPKKALVKKSTPKKMTPKKSVSKKTTPGKSTPKKTLKKETPKKTPKKTTPAKKTPKKSTPGKTPDKKNKKPFKQATLFDVGAKKSAKKDSAGMITKVTSPKSPRQPPIANKMFRIKSKDQEKYKKLVTKAAKELTEQQVKNLRPEIRDDVLIKFKQRMEKLKWQNMTPEEREKILQQKKEEKRKKRGEERQKKAEELRKLKMEQAKRYEDQDLALKPLPAPKLVSMPEGLPNALFGDIAMVVEFLNCYSGLLMPDDPYPVAADPLMKALVYGKEGFAYLARVLVILLKTLLQDEIAEDYRELSMKLSDMTVNMHTSSELLRLSLRRSDHEHNHNDDDRSDYSDSSDEDDDDVPHKLVEKLETCEFFDLEPEEKLELLVCVCHRILGSYAIQDFMEEKQRAAAKLWREKIQSLKEKNDKLKEEKQKKKEQKEAEKLEKEKLKEQQKEEQQDENKDDSSDDKKVNGEVPADKDTKKKKPKKVAKKESKTETKEEKPVESKPPPDEELDLASVVKRRRVLAAKLKAEKAEQDKLDRERRIKEQEALRKQRDEQLFQKNFEDGIQLAKLSLRQSPVGTDRSHSRYWIFSSVIPGLFIEKGWADKDVGYNPNTGEQENGEEELEAGSSKEVKHTEHTIPKVGQNLWFQYSSVKEIDNLLDALNNQGIRESALYIELKKRYEDITRMTYLSRRSGPDLRDSDGPKELLDSFREDLSDVELNVRQGQLGGVKNFEKWEKKLMSSTKLKDLGVLMIESQEGVNPKFLQGIMAPVKRKPQQTNKEEEEDSEEDDQSNEAVEKSEKLLKWVEAAKSAPTLSRLHVFLAVYETCIKWEKSAANAKCKICRKKGDDSKLLLCDECNQPFHLFCLRPALTVVPKGEWKCPACAPSERRASRSRTYFGMESSEESESSSEEEIEHDETCAVCEEDGELVECYRCPAVYHRECHDPPLKNYPRGRWKCSDCVNPGRSRRANKARQKRAAERRRQREMEETKTQRSSRNTKSTKQPKKASKNVTFDSEVAEGIISKLMCYRGSAPFRTSPDKTEAPDYDEIIKIPMDLHMVKNKCCSDEYETYEEFFADVKLIFANAHEYYQESDYVSKQATKLEDYFINQVKWAIPDAISVWESLGQESSSTQQNGPTNQRPTRRSSRR